MIRKEKKLARKEQRWEMTKTCISWHSSEFTEDKLSYIRSNLAQQTQQLTCFLTGEWDKSFFHKANPGISQTLTDNYKKRKQKHFDHF